jgi:hypothetical protein
MPITALIISAMAILGRDERVPPNEELATSIAAAVEDEPDALLWAMRMTVYSFYESRFGFHWNGLTMEYDACRSGDGGLSWGFFQLQDTPRWMACASAPAAQAWLRKAHDSLRVCHSLAAVAYGHCSKTMRVTRFRERETARVMREVNQ